MSRPHCRVFLAGEGPTDIGDLARHPNYRGDTEGFLQPLLRGLVGDGIELEFDGRKIASLSAEPKPNLARDGIARRARQAAALAHAFDCDYLVFVNDVDKEGGSKANKRERRRQLRALRERIRAGLSSAEEDEIAVVAILATPCRMIEAWALADKAALEREFALEVDPPKGSPEHLWGDKRDEASNHPKRVLERVLGLRPQAPDFAAIARASDPSILRERCPESFAPFAEEVENARSECEQGRS